MRCKPSTWEAGVLAFLLSIMGHIFLDSLGYIEFIVKTHLQKLRAEDSIAQREHMNKEREIRKETMGRERREERNDNDDDDDDEILLGAQTDRKFTAVLLPQS